MIKEQKKSKIVLILLLSTFLIIVPVFGNTIEIGTCTDLQNVNNGLGLNYTLFTNIDCTGFTWNPIGSLNSPFTGRFDGKNFAISNLNFNNANTDNAGLFAFTSGASISNLWLKNFNIVGQNNVGALSAQSLDTEIVNVHLYGGSGVTNQISGQSKVGGLFGIFSISLIGTANLVSKVGVSDSNLVCNNLCGGLFGEFQNSNGNAMTTSISEFYVKNTVSLTGVENIGGVFGDLASQSTSQCTISFANGYSQASITGTGNANQLGGFGANLVSNCGVSIQQTFIQVTWTNAPTNSGSYFSSGSSNIDVTGENYFDTTLSTFAFLGTSYTGTNTGSATGASTASLTTSVSNDFSNLIWNQLALLVESYSPPLSACSQDTCGLAGLCLPTSTCYCGSNFAPLNDPFSCQKLDTCSAFNFSDSGSTNVDSSLYQSALDSNFVNGNWEIGFSFQSIYNAIRNVTIFSTRTGQTCSNSISYLANTPGAKQNEWSQALTDVSSSCYDKISGSLPWTDISGCMKDVSDPNLFEAVVKIETTIFSANYTDSGFGRRNKIGSRDNGQIVYIQSTNVSFEFAATLTAISDAFVFLQVGYNSNFTANVTSPDANLTCFDVALGNQFNFTPNLLIFPQGINTTIFIPQITNGIALESSLGNGTAIITAIKNYILVNGPFSACNITLIDVTAPPVTIKISASYLVTYYNLDPTSLTLTVVLKQQISYPFIVGLNNSQLTGHTNGAYNISISDSTFANNTNTQTVTLLFDLKGLNCSGFSESIKLYLQPICAPGTSALDCVLYTQTLAGRRLIDSFSLIASWCPFQQRTTLHAKSFQLFEGTSNTPVADGGILTQSRSLRALINVTIDSQVTGAVLSSAKISTLTFSDGVSSSEIPLAQYPQTFGNFVPNAYFLVNFTHVIDPAQFPNFDFNRALRYTAVIDAVFAPATKKRGVAKRAQFSYSLDSDSPNFRVSAAPVITTPSSPPSTPSTPSSPPNEVPNNNDKNGSSFPITIVIAAAAGGVGIIVVIIIVVIVLRRRKKSYAEQKEGEVNAIEMFDQKNSNNNNNI